MPSILRKQKSTPPLSPLDDEEDSSPFKNIYQAKTGPFMLSQRTNDERATDSEVDGDEGEEDNMSEMMQTFL